MKYFSHLNTAVQILNQYDGAIPFGSYIKQFFATDKKYGSKDRRNISQLCYACFRLGKALQHLPVQERVLIALHACTPSPEELKQFLKPQSDATVNAQEIFPWGDLLSEGVDHEQYGASFLTQPDLFLRVRQRGVTDKLAAAGIPFTELSPACLALPNTSKVDTLIELDKEAVIQDYTSQRIGEFFPKAVKVWDACAASGGKSIMAYDLLKPIDLTVSDVRDTILINLDKRFAHAGIQNYNAFIADLVTLKQKIPFAPFDFIIADVPCSGSGTWARTPEQLAYWRMEELERYSNLQRQIVQNTIPYLKPGGYLLYVTCSVFKKENEEQIVWMKKEFGLKVVKQDLLVGYDRKADTMFASLLTT